MFESLGGFFAVADESNSNHVPLTAASLIQAFPARVAAVDDALPSVTHLTASARKRVIVSVSHQGWMARLLSPILAVRVTGVRGGFLWRPDATSFFELALNPDVVTGTGTVRDFTQQVHDRYGMSMKVLGGNAASALNNAAQLMLHEGHNDAIDETASIIMRELQLGEPPLGPRFSRTSCCLIYKLTLPTRSLCGDCVLRTTG